MKRLGWLVTSLSLSAACSDGNAPDEDGRLLAALDHTRPTIESPAVITAGQPFSVTINTLLACGDRADGIDVTLIGSVARVVLYDAVPGPNDPIPMCLVGSGSVARSATLILPAPGPAIIRAVGRKGGDKPGRDSVEIPVTVEQ